MRVKANFLHIECFLEVAKQLSFTKAALELGLPQPVVSKQIKQLEEALKTQLFIRSKREVSLSKQGLQLKNKLGPSFRQITECIDNLGNSDSIVEGQLRIASLREFGQSILSKLLADWALIHPETNVQLELLPSKEIIEKLKLGTIDAAIVYSEIISENINLYSIRHQEVVLVANPNVSDLTNTNYAKQAFVRYSEDEYILEKVLKKHLQKRKLSKLNIKFQCRSHFALRNFILNYPAFAALPLNLVEEDIDRGDLKLVSSKVEKSPLYLAVNNLEYEPSMTKSLRKFLQERLT
jgi:DNA-binding transcriptional LysR family regulator